MERGFVLTRTAAAGSVLNRARGRFLQWSASSARVHLFLLTLGVVCGAVSAGVDILIDLIRQGIAFLCPTLFSSRSILPVIQKDLRSLARTYPRSVFFVARECAHFFHIE